MLGNSDVRHGLTTTFPNLTGKNLSLNACAAGNSTTAVLTTEQVFDLSRPQTEAACEAAYGKESFTGMLRLAYARLISSFVGEQEVGFYITESDGGPEGHAAIRVQFDARSSNAQMSGRLQHGGCVPDPAVVTDCMLSIDLDGRQAESALDTEMRDGCQFHLHICASESNDLITFRLAYRATLFPEAFARDILAQYEQILCWLIAHPQTSCLAHVDYSRIPTRGLSILNPTPVEHTSKNAVQVWPTLLHQLVERQAELHPKRVALEFLHSLEDNSRTLLTYAELNDRSNQLARHLVSYGVSSDDKIPLCMDRSPNMYIVVLAILKAGCAFVPLASDLPIDRFGYVVREVGPKLIIIDGSAPRAALQKNVIGSVPILDIESNFVDDMRSALPSGNLKVSVAANNLAYILLTSGSTGVPKLVQIEHKAAVESILSHHAIVSHDETSVMLAVSSYTFDVSVFDMFFPLSTGIRLVSSSKELLLSNLEEVINSNGITLMEMTPTVAGMLSRQAVPGIKLLLTIGEMLTRKVVDEWAPGGCLLPLYGPTECTIHCTYAPNFLPDTKPTDIGVPMDTCSMYVMPQQLDEAKPICLDALPIGHVGELYVGGHQIARGYLNRPEANAKSYFNDPYSGGGRIYRTGDLVRMLPKGTLEIIGRVSNDSQVKLRGQRIELLDISHQVQSAHERIEDVLTVVVADEEGAGGKLLVSYLVCGAKHGMHTLFEYEGLKVLQSPVVEQLVQETVAARLPPYMRPNATLLVESIPKSSSGKADVRRLKAVFSEYQKRQMRKTLASETEALTNALTFDDPIAVIVRDLVCEISHTAPTSVSPETSIFFLGIDSLASFALCRRLRAQGLSISMSQILKNPTIGGIAAGVQKVAAAHTTDPAADSFRQLFTEQLAGINRIGIAEALKTDASSIEDTYPVTPVQEGLLTEALADPTGRAFYDLIVIRATQPEATNQLKEAWHDIVSAHPILRTGFVEVPRSLEAPWKLLQLVWTSEQCAASFSEVAIDSEDALDIITQELQESLTLTLDNLHIPPVHMRHVRVTSNGASWLLLKIHHAVYDGWSVPLLLRELKEHIDGTFQILPSPSFREYVEHTMRDHHMHKEKASQFWRSYLQELPILQEFPCLVSGVGEHPTVTVAMTSRTTSVKSSTVERFCHTTSITQQTVFFAIWAKLLSLYKGQLDVTFGTTLAGRASNLDNIENLLGPCVQMAVIRADASADDQTLLRTIQRASADVLENSFISLGEIGRSLERREDTKKLFDTFCVLQKYEEHVDAGCERFEVAETKDFVAHKVTIEIETKDGFVALRCRYNTGVLRPAHAASLLEEYEDLLMKLINGQQHTPAPTTLSTFPAQCVVLPLDDATTLPLPLGCAGELCVKTSLVGDNISDALFRTGNVVRMLPDGELLHLGVRNRDPSVSESPFASKPSGPAIEQSVESELMSLLAEFSRVSIADISRSTSIFQLGFDSLLAVQFSARLKKEMGIQLSMSDILACGSVEKMSERLMKRVDASVPITLGCDLILTFDRTYRKAILDHLGVPSASVSMIYPCTPMQETMLAATARGEQTYLNHWFFKIDPIVDVERLHKAWKEVVTATDALRTSFVQLGEILDGEVTDHSVAQVVWSEPEFRWESLSLTGKLDAVSMAADAKAELNSSVPPLYFKHITSEVGQYLMVTIHHALYDARSWQLIVTHVQRSIAGNDLPIYKQFSWAVPKILQRSAQNEEASRVFWERLFDGFEPTTFPDLSGTSVKSPGRHAVIRELTASDSAHIIQKCRDIGITLPVLGMAAWGLLLQAYTGQSEVAFGVVLSGRSDGLDTCTGPCINTLPFRMGKGASGTSNEVFLQSLLQAYTNLLEHQFTPLPKVNTLASASRPLCDTLFVFDKVEPTKEDDVIRVETVVAPTEASIAVEFLCGKDGLSIEIDYGTALCSESQAVILAGQFEETLLNLVKPNALTNEWHMSSPLLSIARRTQTSTVSLLEERLMHDYVSEHAEHRPTAIALEFAAQLIEGNHFNEKISYADLNNRANQIAHLIRSKGLELEDRIVVCLPRSPLFYATMLGVLKVGGVYVPIDPDMPSERKAYIARDTEAPLILTTLDLSGQFDQITDAQIIALDTPLVTAALKSLPGSNVGLQELRSSHLAYCAYTSGTTGKPSGVLVTHSNVFHALTAFREKITSLTPTSRFMQLASVTFDVSIFETFLPWSVGATVVTAPREAILADVTQAICILRVTHADLTSTVASYVKSKDVPQLQTLVTGGEKLSPEVLADWGPTGKLANAYGPTETTIGVSMLFPVTTSSKPINIGPPLPGVDVFVLSINENPTLVPRGGIGELCIGGPFVTRGYLNKELQTADKYISWLNPVERSGKAERLYRTGDLARLLPDDSLEYLGRTDQQVKINGQRVELAEIDAVILQAHFDLSASCSILFDDKIRNLKELVTFIVSGNTDNGETVALPLSEKFQTLSTDLRIFVRQRLPAYMVPRRFIFVNKLPVTSNGKLDVKLLENFCGSKQHREIGIDRQMSSLEKKIAAIVAAVMKIEPKTITASTTLLEVGIDSLKAMLVSSRLRRDGIELSVSVLLQDLSIADLAIFHEESEAKFELAGLISVGKAKLAAYQDRHYLAVAKSVNDPADIGELLPLLPMQAALIAQTSQSDAAVYLNHFVFELPPDTDFGALRAAWVEAGYRTPILRTGFVNDSAVVYKTTHFDFCSVEELHPDVSLGEAIQHWKAELRDCLKGGVPPIKVALIKESNVSKMILVIHHALYDGWSLRFLLADVQRLCRRESIRQRPPFAKFCEFFCGIDLSSALAYWTAELQDISPAFFPSIGGKRLVGPDHGTQRRSLLPVWMLNDFCKRHRVTPAALGQLVWGKLLGYYTRSHDVVFGNVVSGRNIPLDGIEDVIGPTFNTIPCRVRLPFGQSNNTVMQQLQKNNAMATPHQFCPIRDIQKALAGQTDGMALFNTLFVFQNGQTEKLAAEDHLWDEIQSLAAMDYSVSIEMEIDGDSLCLRVGARGDSMEEGYADTLLQQLDAILLDVVRAPQADVQKCHFPPELLSLANSPPTVYPTTDLLHSQFESYAAYTPNVAAVEWVLRENGAETVNLSFGDMNREANRVAHALLGMGATRRVIPVLMDKSLRMYSTVLGILKAGGAFTPIDPTLPQAIRMHMLQDSDGPIVCTNAKYLEELDSISGVALNMDDTKIFDGFPDTNPSGVPVTSSDRAYVLYTSGTTSLPKGVQIQHASVVQSIRSFCECIPFPENSRNLQLAGVSFDVAWCELFCAWFRGFTLVSGPKDVLLRNLPGTASALRITHLSMTPSIASMFKREWFPTLRVLILGGEMLTQAVLDEWAGRDDVLLFNAYGPSESTIGCVMHTRVQKSTKPSNIGFPLPTCSIFVVDEQLRFVPKGVVGELVVGGPQVGKGYANRPELTAEKFITLRLPQGDRVRAYLTGDLGRLLPDGCIEFLGRADEQIKLNGIRIELAGINTVLLAAHPAICDVVTIATRRQEHNKDQIVSFVTLDESSHQASSALVPLASSAPAVHQAMTAASLGLPHYMIPSHVFHIASLPTTPNHKVDKRELIRLYQSVDLDSGDTVEEAGEWTPLEKSIHQLVASVAKIAPDTLGKSTSFFRVGIDSLTAIQIASKALENGWDIPVSEIMRHPSVDRIARLIENQQIGEDISENKSEAFNVRARELAEKVKSMEVTPRAGIPKVYPCTPLQEGMLLETLKSSGRYINHMILRIESWIDMERFKHAWSMVIAKNDILRTSFSQTDSFVAFAQVVHDRFDCKWTHIEVAANEELDTAIRVQMERVTEKHKKLVGIPIAFALVESPEERRVVVSMHHALYDGFSLPLIFRDVIDAYEGRDPAIRPQFEHLVRYIDGLDGQISEKYWNLALQDCLPSIFPEDLSGEFVTRREKVEQTIECSISRQEVDDVCQQLGVAFQAVAQAAWGKILRAYIGNDDVVFGHVVSGRTVPMKNATNIIGPFLNTIPCRVTFDSSQTNGDVVRRVHANNIAVLPHQHTPLRSIQKWIENRAAGGRQLFDTLFVFQKHQGGHSEGSGWELMDGGKADVEYALSLEVEQQQDVYSFYAACPASIMSSDPLRILLQQLDEAIVYILRHPDSPCTLLTQVFNEKLLSVHNAGIGVSEYPGLEYMHRGVEFFARETPDHPALEFATFGDVIINERLSYAELNSHANWVAYSLIRSGVAPGSLVPICVEKSVWMYVAVLGVLKASCSFVSLDPDAPVDRKKFIINDVEASHVVVSRAQAQLWASECAVKVLVVDASSLSRLTQSTSNPDVRIPVSQSAYMIYTSGTSGTPKGVEISHENVAHALGSFRELLPVSRETRFLQFATIAFDVFVFECFLSWSAGATVVTSSKECLLADLPGAIRRLRATAADLTPTVAAMISRKDVPSLSLLVCGGEALTQHVLDEFSGQDGLMLVNAYGPTELTIGCTLLRPVTKSIRPNNIGQLFPTCSGYVLSEDGAIAVRGGIGELCVGGPQVAPNGYHNRPELTEERFTLAPITKEGIYKTGDYVKMLHDGSILFLGRRDDQHKLNGIRVELGEVTAWAKKSHDAIQDGITLLLRHPRQMRDQIVFFAACDVGKIGDAADADLLIRSDSAIVKTIVKDILRTAREKLPAYLVPSTVLLLKRVPRGRTEKADTKELSRLYCSLDLADIAVNSDGSTVDGDDVWTPTERIIQDAIISLTNLNADEVFRTVTIFSMGLDSIAAIMLSCKLKEANLDLTVADILQNPTIELMAIIQGKKQETKSGSLARRSWRDSSVARSLNDPSIRNQVAELLSIAPKDIAEVLPATPGQIFVMSAWLSSSKRSYVACFPFIILNKKEEPTRFCPDRFQRAWRALTFRHSILRTTFVSCPSDRGFSADFPLLQVILDKTLPAAWRNDKLAEVSLSAESVATLLEVETRQPLDLTSPPVVGRLVEYENGGCFFLTMHHALYDAWSLRVLREELAALYHTIDSSAPTPELNNASLDFVHYCAEQLFSGVTELDTRGVSHEEFWRESLKGSQTTIFPRSNPMLPAESTDGVRRTAILIENAVKNASMCEDACRKLGISLHSVFLAAWAKTSFRATNTANPIFGIFNSGRSAPIPGIQHFADPTFNVVPVAPKACDTTRLIDLAKQMHQDLNAMTPHIQLPLHKIQEWAGYGRERLFNTNVNFLKLPRRSENTAEALFEPVEAKPTSNLQRTMPIYSSCLDDLPTASLVKIDVDVEIVVRGDGTIAVGVFADSSYLTEEDGNRVIRELCEMVEYGLLAAQ